MKKIILTIILSALFLCGCDAVNEKEQESEYYSDLAKTQEITAISADTSDILQKMTEKQEISDFISALDIEHWELESLPETAKLTGTFQFSQEETLKFGQDASDREISIICEILCYEDIPYLTLKTAGVKISFRVSETTMEYLTQYFQ